ncbi:MAG: acyl carrier protein [Bacteroidia bacterium]
MTNIEEFTKKLESEFEEIAPGTIHPDTSYRDIKGWSSMYALIIIAFVDANYDVALTANDLRSSQTIRDLYNVIIAKKQA